MAYLELTKEAYNDIINASGMKGSKIARICEEQGVWSKEADAEAPVVVEPTPATTYDSRDPVPDAAELNLPVPDEATNDPLMDMSDD